jgi:uncharacterized protein YutD
MNKMSKLRKFIYLIVAVGAAYFVLTFVASFMQYLSNK